MAILCCSRKKNTKPPDATEPAKANLLQPQEMPETERNTRISDPMLKKDRSPKRKKTPFKPPRRMFSISGFGNSRVKKTLVKAEVLRAASEIWLRGNLLE